MRCGWKQIKKFVSREGGILYLRSAPVGIAIGCIAGYLMIPEDFNLLNSLLIIALVLIVVYIITMLSVHKPARLAAAVSPMEALRYVPQERMKKAANKKPCRSLTPMGLGVMNFSRNRKKKQLSHCSLLALGGILFMTAATYMSSFDQANYARQGYFTDAEFHIGYSPSAIQRNKNGMGGIQAIKPMGNEMVREIAALDGVEKVTEIKSFGARFDYPVNDEYGNDDMIYPLTEEETMEIGKYLESGSGDYILAAGNGTAFEIYGCEFTTGESITLHYYDGRKMAEKKLRYLVF